MSSPFRLLTDSPDSPKLAHELEQETSYRTAVLYLAPHTFGGRGNVCRWSTNECRKACIGTETGRAAIIPAGQATNAVREARSRRTQWFFDDHRKFIVALLDDIQRHAERCARLSYRPAVRLNGSSDIPWERVAPEAFAMVDMCGGRTYDYTKAPMSARQDIPDSYHLTFSWSGHNADECFQALSAGRNVAAPFRLKPSQSMPQYVRDIAPDHPLASWPVIDGDVSDQRFLDPSGVVVGLRAKGTLRRSPKGNPFIIESA